LKLHLLRPNAARHHLKQKNTNVIAIFTNDLKCTEHISISRTNYIDKQASETSESSKKVLLAQHLLND
jgi:hypothetical protein